MCNTSKLLTSEVMENDTTSSSRYNFIERPRNGSQAWVSMRKIPTDCVVKLGRKLLFDLDAVNQWLATCKRGQALLMFST